MSAAPQYATITFATRLGTRIPVDIYLSDVAAAAVRWDNGQGASATTPDYFTAPETLTIVDFSIPTGMTDTTKVMPTINNKTVGATVRFANQLNTLAYRSPIGIVIGAGQTLRLLQLAN